LGEIVKNIDDEIPFDIPRNWCWARFRNVFDVRDGTHDTPKYVSRGVPLVTSKNLKSNGLDLSNAKLISEEDYNTISIRSEVIEGDILFAMIGSIGNPVIIQKDLPKFAIKNMALFKYYNSDLYFNKYLYYFLLFAQDQMKKIASGGVQSFVSLEFLRNYLFPLPPVAEQHLMIVTIKSVFEYLNLLKQ
jgi:type I restriction enzyme S subunit